MDLTDHFFHSINGESKVIKQSSMLFAAAIFSYGVPHVYAETLISYKMSVDQIKAVIAEHDRGPDMIQSADPENQYGTYHYQPSYVDLDLSGPSKVVDGPCKKPTPSYSLTGYDMGNTEIIGTFFVTAITNRPNNPPNVDEVPWVSLPKNDFPEGAGIASGDGWALIQKNDTFGNRWELYTQADVIIHSIKINIWDRYTITAVNDNGRVTGKELIPVGPHGVFDVYGVGTDQVTGQVTPGSENGYPFTKNSLNWPTSTRVVYSVRVLGTPNDLFGTVTINFPDGFRGSSSIIGGFLAYIADTDCMPATQAEAVSNGKGFDITLTGIGGGMAYAQRTCGGVSHVIDTYEVPLDGFRFGVAKADLKKGCQYSFTDEAGNAIPLIVDGDEMPDNEYRP